VSRKKIDIRAGVALVAFAVVLVTGGVLYAQAGSKAGEASLVLSRPDMVINTQADPTPTAAPSATASVPPKPAIKKKKVVAAKKAVAKKAKKAAKAKQAKKAAKSAAPASGGGSSTAVAPKSAAGDQVRFGKTYSGIATFYGATGAGNCSYDPTSDLMVAAMNAPQYQGSQACGAYVDVTGPAGNTIRVKIVDSCPECESGHLDLSAQAFAKLADPVKGRIDISWKLVSPALSGPVTYVYKDGSTQWWCGIQVRNHRTPIRTVELKSSGSWITLQRQSYNYFLSANGTGCGGSVRITDVQGNQLTDTGIAVKPGVAQAGAKQLPAA
jgi:expansin (peptidoglycan-binding protein)